MMIIKSIKLFGSLALIAFLVWQFLQNKDVLIAVRESFNLYNIVLLILLGFLVQGINILSWHIITLSLGLKIKFFDNFASWTLSNITRLLPGGFWQYPSRVYLLSRLGIDKAQASTALVVEGLVNLATGALLALVLIYLIGEKNLNLPLAPIYILLFLVTILLLIFSRRKINVYAFKFITKFSKGRVNIQSVNIPLYLMVLILFAFIAQYSMAGIVVYSVTNAIYPISVDLIPIMICMYAVSWVIGYISFFAPGGLGVQELSMATLLSLFIPFSIASVVVLFVRIFLVLTELLLVLFVNFFMSKNIR